MHTRKGSTQAKYPRKYRNWNVYEFGRRVCVVIIKLFYFHAKSVLVEVKFFVTKRKHFLAANFPHQHWWSVGKNTNEFFTSARRYSCGRESEKFFSCWWASGRYRYITITIRLCVYTNEGQQTDKFKSAETCVDYFSIPIAVACRFDCCRDFPDDHRPYLTCLRPKLCSPSRDHLKLIEKIAHGGDEEWRNSTVNTRSANKSRKVQGQIPIKFAHSRFHVSVACERKSN